MTISEIKVEVEARIGQAHEEAMSDTYSGFLYTLWLNHPEVDFSFFGEEAIEEVKQYAAKTVNDVEASTPLDPTEVILPTVMLRSS